MFALVNAPAVAEASATDRQLPIYCVQRDQKMLAISFDAAWGNEDTQQLIDILGKYNVKATFFVVGDWVDKYPESVKALHDAGHEVMNHSNSHAHMSQLSSEAIVADVEACNDKIEAVTGVRPTLIRPPYGEYDNNVITSDPLHRDGSPSSGTWTVWSWKTLPAGEITERAGEPGPARVHRSLPQRRPSIPPRPLPAILETLLQEGYTFVPISELILPGEYNVDYTIDHTGRQLPAQPSSSPR